jgi:hypothetical protein
MFNISVRSGVLLAALASASTSGACAKQAKPPQVAQRAERARGEMKETERLTATVESIDHANQTVMLRDDEGHRFAIEADEGALAQLKPEDQIKVAYQEAVAFSLQDPAQAASDTPGTKIEQETEQQKNNGLKVGRRVTTTVKILSVAPGGEAVEFQVPEGPVRTIAIEDTENQSKVKNLRPGDSVNVTYTEKLALAVDPAS